MMLSTLNVYVFTLENAMLERFGSLVAPHALALPHEKSFKIQDSVDVGSTHRLHR